MSQDALNPTGPAQPNLDQVYETSGNAATKEPAEARIAQQQAGRPTDQRIPQQQSSSIADATPSSMGYGVRDSSQDKEGPLVSSNQTLATAAGTASEEDADQMAAPTEGKIADAEARHPGASGTQEGLESDLDRKKREQAPMREEMKQRKGEEFSVGGILGQRGGPANPVEQGNYPNSDKY
ncbi:hypothetical protein Tdes44962_MAKER05710 [Teratosphaeria destructans]|uniref:Uncharacterized protein n=1 Tax=Teratosphaeria destructans TaxID=418781 RepID=A0A9W7SJ61_9PEZI|nr:hypothetical protein Tdes44962_MAKER05710 [Teratosphaeria destructans]